MVALEKVGPEAFEGDRLARPGVWAVAFLADWCPFCRAFRPAWEALAAAHAPVILGDVTDDESPLWDRFHIDVIPTVIVFRDGKVSERFDGVAGEGLAPKQLARISAAIGRASASRGGTGTPPSRPGGP